MQLGDNSKQEKIADKDKPVVDHKKNMKLAEENIWENTWKPHKLMIT